MWSSGCGVIMVERDLMFESHSKQGVFILLMWRQVFELDTNSAEVVVEVVKGRKSRNFKRVVMDTEESWVERIMDFKFGEFEAGWGN